MNFIIVQMIRSIRSENLTQVLEIISDVKQSWVTPFPFIEIFVGGQNGVT